MKYIIISIILGARLFLFIDDALHVCFTLVWIFSKCAFTSYWPRHTWFQLVWNWKAYTQNTSIKGRSNLYVSCHETLMYFILREQFTW